MSVNKYADLPDIDTAPDIYETDDIFPSALAANVDSSDDEATLPSRSAPKPRIDLVGKEDIDSSNLMDPEEASKKFRKAEKRRDRTRTRYAYPPSPTSSSSPTRPSATSRPVPLSHRLQALQTELSALETELADPSNPLLQTGKEEDAIDPGELIRGLVDVRGRLEKIRKDKQGRGKLVGVVLGERDDRETRRPGESTQATVKRGTGPIVSDAPSIVEMDRRVGELEKLLGSSSVTLDEISPLPPPLLPLITRLNAQLTLLTQPRHIDSISRRLKLLLSDLDRASVQNHSHRRHPSHPTSSAQSSQVQDQLLPLLSRLGPSLPHIPHILTRLRTLSALHASAAEFQSALGSLEQEQQKLDEALNELEGAVETVEKSLEDNRGVVQGNVASLDSRVEALLARLGELSRTTSV